MQVIEAIRRRRAVREYTSEPVERKIIEGLIEASILAPSAENHQPWQFAILLDQRRIDAYAERAKAWLLNHPEHLTLDPALQYVLNYPHFSIFYHAPALIVILAESAEPQAREDCCLAAQNLLLAARDAELGTCWISTSRPWFDLPEIKTELGLPANASVVAPIVLGHPKEWPMSHGRNPARIRWL